MKNPIKIVLYAAFGAIFCSISACKKTCKTYTQYETAPVILEYFVNYKPGNYWIYENQDGTKRDSMWVSDYGEEIAVNDLSSGGCNEFLIIRYSLHSQYLYSGLKINVIISNRGNEESFVFFRDSTITSDLIDFFWLKASVKNNSLISVVQKNNFKTYNNKGLVFANGFEYSYPLNPIYPQADSQTYLFASKIGLVGYCNKIDTFSLIKNYL